MGDMLRRYVLLCVALCACIAACDAGDGDGARVAEMGQDDAGQDLASEPEMMDVDAAEDLASTPDGDMELGEDAAPDMPNRCPVAVATATIVGRPDAPADELRAQPLMTVKLSALESYDPDGRIEEFAWNIITKPSGSVARLVSSNRIAEPSLFLDLSGVYEIELSVVDNERQASCEAARVRVVTPRAPDVHVQLVWTTPGDADAQDATGADLDLHYLHPDATAWDAAPWDASASNPAPMWGVEHVYDDPSLDADDSDGAGPENINHDYPEPGVYKIGVYYKDDGGFGASLATARIYVRGALAAEVKDVALDAQGMFWEVGEVAWPSGVVTTGTTVTQGFPAVMR